MEGIVGKFRVHVICDGCGLMEIAAETDSRDELIEAASRARTPLEASGWMFSPRNEAGEHAGDFCGRCVAKRREGELRWISRSR